MPYSVKQKLGYIIKINRKLRNMSQKDLSAKINYNQSIVSKAEQGNFNLSTDIYCQLLNVFHLKFEVNELFTKEVNQFIEEIFYHVVTFKEMDVEALLLRLRKLSEKNRNVFYTYDLMVLELIIYFYLNDHKKCIEIMEALTPFYSICHEKCQFLFFYLNHYLAYYVRIGKRLEIPQEILSIGKEHGLDHYVLAWKYLYEFNYSQAITELTLSIKRFKEKNYHCRIVLCEIQINKILLMDKQFLDVVNRSLEFIEQFQTCSKVTNAIDELYFQLSYSYYHLKDYEKAKEAIHFVHMSDSFVPYLKYKIYVQLGESPELETSYDTKDTALIKLYHQNKNDAYYELIEKHLIDKLEQEIYKVEYQVYALELLNYYWACKKYKKYKKLSDLLNKILIYH